MKLCNKCLEQKPLDMFWKNKSNKDGLQKICKACLRADRQSNPLWPEREFKRLRLTGRDY